MDGAQSFDDQVTTWVELVPKLSQSPWVAVEATLVKTSWTVVAVVASMALGTAATQRQMSEAMSRW